MDAVLLSGFANVPAGGSMVDMGTGTGIIPILMAAKTEAAYLTGLEIQEESADMAERSVLLNKLQERVDIVNGDIKNIENIFPRGQMDAVTCNPPYMTAGKGLANPDAPKAIARHEILCTLDDVVSAARYLLKPQGAFYMVHRPLRLVEIFSDMRKYGIEPKRMRLVYPYADKEPNMVLIEGRKGGKPELRVEKPLVIYEEPGKYTKEIYEIYEN
ncbi:tRNA1Val (adenine37-N6)-methyltransferase [Lachnospiraceae bacterium KH1T2]|nr:tRNA1Val (adenine37-N6)-methyltransferase [Lachnospiraceae bacterium KH1T2]